MSMNNLKYKALALDLDGTLTDSNKNIPSKNKAAVQKAMDLGVKIILISGRPVMGIAALQKSWSLKNEGGLLPHLTAGKRPTVKRAILSSNYFSQKK